MFLEYFMSIAEGFMCVNILFVSSERHALKFFVNVENRCSAYGIMVIE